MGKLSDAYRKRHNKDEEKEKKSSVTSDNSTSSSLGNLGRKVREREFGLDTLESDLHTMGETLNNIYGSWQTKETMDNTFESVNKMYNRLVGYQDYHTQYGKESGLPDLSELLNTYKNAVDKWGDQTKLYGNYQNADAYNKAVKNFQLSEKFKGLSYGDVQARMRRYSPDSDEYNYLKNYTGYTSTEDFDKAIAGLSTDIGMFDKANEYEGRISSYEGQADKFKKRTNGLTNDGGYGKKADETRAEYDAWLKENGFDSGNALKAEYADEVKLAKELGKAKNIYELDNSTADKYKYLEQNEDFAEHSQYDSSVNEGKKPHYQPFTNYDIKYDYINNVPEIRDSYERKAGNKDAGTAFSDNGWEYLTEKELAYYNYLHYLDGQNGTKKSDKFLEDLKPALQKRYSEKASERREEMLENPFAATAFSLASPIMTIAGGIGNLMATGKDIVTGSEYNPYDPLREISNANAHGREVVSQNIAEATKGFELFGQNIASFLYNTGESVLDTVVGGSAFGRGYTALMGTNAYQQKAKELTEQGYDATTVQGLAITSGVLEMAFEYAGFDHLMKLKDADSIGKVIYNALVSQGGAEGLEELGTSIGNMIAEYGFLGEDSQYMKKYNDLIARGFSEKEASIEVAKAMASELAWSFAGGWLSGAGLGAGTSIGQYTQNKAVGKDLRGAERIGDVLNIASMTPHESEAYEAYTRYANKGVNADNITDAQLGNLYNTMSSEVKGGFRTAVTDLANAHGEMTTQRTTLGYEYESAKKDMLSAKAEIDTLKGIIDSKESTEVQKASASADLDNAIAKYNEAQQRMNKTYDSAVASESLTERQRNKAENKLDKAVSEYTDAQARMGKYAPIADKLSGVEESVGAYNAKRAVEKAEAEKRAKHEAEVKKLSSGVETSVMADTDKAIEIKGMKDSDTLITSDGEVKLKDVELSDRDADLVAYARGMEASEASLYLEQYKGEENIEEYTNTFSLVTSMAKNNYSEDAILKAKGSLSTEQFNAIYAATVTERYREKQRNIDKLNAEMAGKMSYKGVIDDSVINYGNKTVKGKVKWSDLNSRQREAITFISGFAKATGINLKLIADGEKRGINGSYDPSSNTITIDVYAGMSKSKNLLKDTIIPTMSHETTHWMKEKSPELYRKMGGLVFKTLEAHDGVSEVDRVASEVARQKAKGKNITDDGARDEIIARACEDMLKMSEEGKKYFNSLSESEKKTFIDKVKEILANLMEWVDNLLNSYSSDRYEAKVMREYKDTLAELSKMWDEMLVSSVQNNSSMELAGVFGHLTNGVSEDGTTIVGENALQMSDRTYREGGRDFLVNWLEGQEGISEEDKQNIIEQTDRIAELMRAVAEDNELPDYSAWADMEVVKDENGEKLLSVIVKNGDYAMNIDFSQVCKKRVALNAVLNAMVQSGDLNVHTLTETDVAELNAIIKEHDFEIACALCFVDSKRYRVGAWAESFCDGSDEKVKGKGMVHKYGFNEMVRSLVPKGSKLKVDEFNFTGRDIAGQPTQNLVSEADDSELDFTLIDKIMSENDVKSAQHRYARAIKEHPEIRKILNKAEIISSIGLDAIRLEAPELYKIVNGHQGTAKPKFSHDVVAYGNDILKASNFTAEKAKMVGGVRCQSFSDFMANMVVDYAQFISELSAKGLTSHSYTKEPLFVKLFGLTGMKINMSLVPKAIDMTPEQQKQFAILKDKNANKRSKAYKEALAEYNKLAENAGLDENGNYIWEDETFPYDIAMEIVVDPRYSANCGTIAVGISKKHILKLLADDRISMVIPYHKSGLNHEVAMMRDIALYNDYTKVQSTRFGYYKSLFGGNAGKKLDGVPDFDFYGDLYGVDGKDGTHDPKTTAQNYLNWCDRHNYIPKFDEFRDNPNYYKLLIDFRVYDVDGTYREQQPVKAIYPSNAEFKDLILNGVVDKNGKVYGGLKQQQQTSDKLSAETQEIVDEYRQRLTEKYGEDVLVQNDDRDDGIQNSDRDDDISVYEKMGELDRVLKERDILKEDIQRLHERLKLEGKVTNGKYFTDSSILNLAGFLLKKADSKYDKVELAKRLKSLYHGMTTNTKVDSDALWSEVLEIANDIALMAKPKIVKNDYALNLLKEIKGARVRFNSNQKAEAKARFGANWNRSFFGKIILADNANMELDEQWQEWVEEHPDIFDAHVKDSDQPMELYDILTTLKEQSEIVEEYNKEEFVQYIATEILGATWNLKPIVTTADKYTAKIKEIRSEHKQAMKDVRDAYNARVDEARLAERMFYGKKMSEMRKEYDAKLEKQRKTDSAKMADKLAETREQHEAEIYEKELAERMHFGAEIAKLRRQKDEKVAEAKELGKQKMADYKENIAKKTKIQSITRNALELVEKRVNNSKDKHIPEIMLGPVDALLDAINFSSKRLLDGGEPTKTDISLAKSLGKIKDMMAKASVKAADELVELYGHGLDESIEKMVENVDRIVDTIGDNEFVLNRMSLEDLQTLDKVVKTIKQAVNKLNKFHVVNHAKGIANLSQESMVYLDSLGRAKVYDGMRGEISKLLNWNNTLPYYAFKRYGEGGMAVYTAFQDGWDKFAFNVKSVMDYAKDAYTNEEVKAWSKEVKEFKILVPAKASDLADDDYTPEYQTVRMTVPQIMSMYCLNKREQARGHFFGGGIRVADFKDSKGKIVSQSDGIVFTEKDISTIFDSLTDRQKTVADKLQEFMNTVCTDWGNEVSMARFGYKAFGEANYFPIQSDKNNLAVDDETEQQNSLFRLLNMSFTKSLNDKANNRIVISDIFDVFAQHSSDMAKYNALALPVLDAFKWYNYKEKQDVADGTFKTKGVKQSIENAFGKNGQSYFTTFLKDINGQQEVSRDTLGKGFFSNAKIASVGANLRVVALQPTSYVRASAVIDSRYLTRAFAHKPKIDKAEKWCGIALWKSMGYYDTNIQKGVVSQIKHDETGLDKAKEKSMKLAEMADKLTWGYLWNACELEIRDKRKDLEVGSDEFYTEIGKRLREVIYATQVVDSTMTRSQMMRSSQFYDKMLTAFASEPTLSYNMLQDAYMGYSLDARRMGKAEAFKKNGKRIARTLVAYTMTNALAALVESGFDAFREDDDEEEMDLATFMKYYLTNFLSDMSITAKIPYIKEAHSVIKGFGSSRTDTQWMDSMVKAGKAWAKTFSGEGSAKSTIKYTLKAFSDVSGLPFYNVYRDSAAFLDKTEIFTSDDLNEMFEDIFN